MPKWLLQVKHPYSLARREQLVGSAARAAVVCSCAVRRVSHREVGYFNTCFCLLARVAYRISLCDLRSPLRASQNDMSGRTYALGFQIILLLITPNTSS